MSPHVTLDPADPFEAALVQIVETNRRKRADYTSSPDRVFENFERAAEQVGITPADGIEYMIATKQARLSALQKRGSTPQNESVLDSKLDRAVYSVLAYALASEVLPPSPERAAARGEVSLAEGPMHPGGTAGERAHPVDPVDQIRDDLRRVGASFLRSATGAIYCLTQDHPADANFTGTASRIAGKPVEAYLSYAYLSCAIRPEMVTAWRDPAELHGATRMHSSATRLPVVRR